ncbi:MAG: N-glycosylase/DNA lyase [Candidatus Gracilibacteria bacterium]|nr:N-glycosylase/DNA lyase [Candidatus Gracilibacteria bacterium]
MEKILKLLENHSNKTSIEIQKQDFQYKSLEFLNNNFKNENIYDLVLANSIICYQLSSTGEAYWEEFGNYFSTNKPKNIINDLKIFIKNSKGNKRFVDTKSKRLDKLTNFLEIFSQKRDFYLNNLVILRDELAKVMNQKTDAKTIVFAIKMIGYVINIKQKVDFVFPYEISIPIDSRLTNLYEKFNDNPDLEIKDFYKKISEITNISPLNLDAIVWVNYEEFMK